MDEMFNNNNFNYNNNYNNIFHKINPKKLHQSSSQVDVKFNTSKKNPQSNFISLINNLSADIKLLYHSIKHSLNQGKNSIYKNKFSSKQIFDLIEKNLDEFIIKAQDIFKRMKYIQKINIIQQEMNSSSPNTDSVYLNSNFENKKKLYDDEIYISKMISQSQKKIDNNMNTSPKINNYFKKNLSDTENDMIKSLNNSSKDMKIINKFDYSYNINENNNRHSANKIIYNTSNRQYNNLKRNNNTKNVINLRKKILFDKKQDNNSSLNSLVLSNSKALNNMNDNNNNNINQNYSNIPRDNKGIFVYLKEILSSLKELKSIKGNIFTKSLEAEKHKNLMSKIYNELIKLIKYLYKNKNNNINNVNNSSDLSGDIQIQNNNNSYNFTFNNKMNNDNNNEDLNKNINTDYFNKEIKYRDLIIQQLQLKQNNNLIKENKNFEIMKQRCIELQKEKEKILLLNNELKKKIIFLEKKISETLKKEQSPIPIFTKQNFSFQCLPKDEYIGEKAKKVIDELNAEINEKKEMIEKIYLELNIYKENDIKTKEEINKLNDEKYKSVEEINKLKKEIENLNMQNNDNINDNKILKENLEIENQNIEKYKKIISYQEEEIKTLKINLTENENKTNKFNSCNTIINLKSESDKKNIKDKSQLKNNINMDDKKNKKRNNNTKINDYQIEQDKIYLKYELLKNDYDKLNNTLQQKQKLLDNYSKISSETASKTNIDEQILELMDKHKKEIDELTKKYNRSIIKLKMNQPAPYSPETHKILVDKRYAKFDLKWYLLTMITEEEKNYENTFWVSEMEMRPLLPQFNDFKTEREIEEEKFDNLYRMQEKWIKQLDEKEKMIELLKDKLDEYENNSGTK